LTSAAFVPVAISQTNRNTLVFWKSRGEAFARLGMNLFITIYGKCFAPTLCGKHCQYWNF
ncbi:MAG: hypothetical protein CV080_10485, partial [Candidatus Kuenenia stuttgartiensis]